MFGAGLGQAGLITPDQGRKYLGEKCNRRLWQNESRLGYGLISTLCVKDRRSRLFLQFLKVHCPIGPSTTTNDSRESIDITIERFIFPVYLGNPSRDTVLVALKSPNS